MYVLKNRLTENWRNEAAWAYIRGMLATTQEEAEASLKSNARKVFIGDQDWLKEEVQNLMKIATKNEFSKDMVMPGDGEDENQAESVAFMRYQGVHQNRFLYATFADIQIADG